MPTATAIKPTRSQSPTAHAAAQGLWQFVREEPIADDRGRQVNDAHTFRLEDDGTVVLRLLSLHAERWKSPDDFYRLATRWQARMLQYRPPFGDWADLASYERGRFIDVGNGKRRIFARIDADAVVDWNRAVLAPRAPHDYRRRPDGSLGDGGQSR